MGGHVSKNGTSRATLSEARSFQIFRTHSGKTWSARSTMQRHGYTTSSRRCLPALGTTSTCSQPGFRCCSKPTNRCGATPRSRRSCAHLQTRWRDSGSDTGAWWVRLGICRGLCSRGFRYILYNVLLLSYSLLFLCTSNYDRNKHDIICIRCILSMYESFVFLLVFWGANTRQRHL